MVHNLGMEKQRAYKRPDGAIIPVWQFNDKLRKARSITGMSQDQFAEQLELKASTYSAYESGRAMPRMRDASPLAHRLQALTRIPAEWFLVTDDHDGNGMEPPRGIEPRTYSLQVNDFNNVIPLRKTA